MKELGYKQVYVWLDKRELEGILKIHGACHIATLVRQLLCDYANIPFYAR